MRRPITIALAAGLALAGAASLTPAQNPPADERAEIQRQLNALEAQQAQLRDRLDRLTEGAEPKRPERAGGPGELIDVVDPEMRERFEQMRRENPERARRFLERHRDRLRELRDLRREDPQAFRQRVEFMRAMREGALLAIEVAELEQAGRDEEAREARQRLRDHAEKLFETRLARQRAQLENLEARLADASANLQQLEASRDRVLDQRVEQAVSSAKRRLEAQRDR